MVLKRMIRQRRILLSLVAAFSLIIGIASGLVLFSEDAYGRVLQSEMQAYAQANHAYIGTVWVQLQPGGVLSDSLLHAADQEIAKAEQWFAGVPVTKRFHLEQYAQGPVSLVVPGAASHPLGLMAPTVMPELSQHARLTDGNWPTYTGMGSVPILISQGTATYYKLTVGQQLTYQLGSTTMPLVVAGVVVPRSTTDAYWTIDSKNDVATTFMIAPSVLGAVMQRFPQLQLQESDWILLLDAGQITYQNANPLISGLGQFSAALNQAAPGAALVVDPTASLREAYDTTTTIEQTISMLGIPLFALLGYFIVLIVQVLRARRAPEWTLLVSRGCGRGQLIFMEAVEYSVVAAFSVVAGAWIAVGVAELIAMSTSFLGMSLHNAAAVQFSSSTENVSILVGTALALFAAAAGLPGRGETVVTRPHAQARQDGSRPMWQRCGVDVLLVLVVIVGFFLLGDSALTHPQSADPAAALAKSVEGPSQTASIVSGALFALPGLASVAVGLLGARAFPFVVRLLSLLTRGLQALPLMMGLRQLCRMPSSYQSLIILLATTLGLGTYSCVMAGSIVSNMQDQVRYAVGADLHIQMDWPIAGRPPSPVSWYTPFGGDPTASPVGPYGPFLYKEPDFSIFVHAPGVVSAARDYITVGNISAGDQLNLHGYMYDSVTQQVKPVQNGSEIGGASIMAVDPYEFSQTAWLPPTLQRTPLGDYLKAMAETPDGAIVSKDFVAQNAAYSLHLGSRISIGDYNFGYATYKIVGIAQYWPSYHQNGLPFIVVNYNDYMDNTLMQRPYDVLLKVRPGASTQAIVNYLNHHGVTVTNASSSLDQIRELELSPMWAGTMGVLSLEFFIALGVTLCGFTLFGVFVLRRRAPEFAALRAIGVTTRQLVQSVLFEITATAVYGVLIGILAGLAASTNFLPKLPLGTTLNVATTLPLSVILPRSGQITLALSALLLIAGAMGIATLSLQRIRLSQALTLGQDA